MKEKTALAVATMYNELLSRHLDSNASRLDPKEIMPRVCRRFRLSRATVYRYLNAHSRREKHRETK